MLNDFLSKGRNIYCDFRVDLYALFLLQADSSCLIYEIFQL